MTSVAGPKTNVNLKKPTNALKYAMSTTTTTRIAIATTARCKKKQRKKGKGGGECKKSKRQLN